VIGRSRATTRRHRVPRPHLRVAIPAEAHLTFIVEDELADAVVEAVVDSARSGNESGDGLVWTTPVENVTHNRTGAKLEKEVEA
jgi:nitrogen regulatory protein PII